MTQQTKDDVYRQPDEKSPQPAAPKRPWWGRRFWDWYAAHYRREPIDVVFYTALLSVFAGAAIAIVFAVGVEIDKAMARHQDPCAQYITVEVDMTTVDGTPVKVPVEKCLRLKAGR